MLWKPYKRKGLSGCFQPSWDSPCSIEKFNGFKKFNCKIVRCVDPEQQMNVHFNQLEYQKDVYPVSDELSNNPLPSEKICYNCKGTTKRYVP